VKLHAARDLGTSANLQPYVRLSIGKEEKTMLNPARDGTSLFEWNQEEQFSEVSQELFLVMISRLCIDKSSGNMRYGYSVIAREVIALHCIV
jgi:hypothetical protein